MYGKDDDVDVIILQEISDDNPANFFVGESEGEKADCCGQYMWSI